MLTKKTGKLNFKVGKAFVDAGSGTDQTANFSELPHAVLRTESSVM